MRAVVCHAFGEIETLRVEQAEAPALPPGGVRIAVRAAGVNFADILLARGEYQEQPPFPFSPGLEAAGTVIEVADGVTRVRPGERVLAFLDSGGFAEEAIAREADVTAIPVAMDDVTAATFPVVYATSHLALCHRARLRPGETLLVHGASGGVGLTAVEVGKALGATVIATASSAEKLALARAHGADMLINYADEDIRERVLELCELLVQGDLGLRWQCETAIKTLDDEMLERMSAAGCVSVSFGVESGNPVLQKKYSRGKIKDRRSVGQR